MTELEFIMDDIRFTMRLQHRAAVCHDPDKRTTKSLDIMESLRTLAQQLREVDLMNYCANCKHYGAPPTGRVHEDERVCGEYPGGNHTVRPRMYACPAFAQRIMTSVDAKGRS